ncbi:MAG TPA: DUF433 domain-containing protein [Galbitalea sp.]|nr:DUF433 domain-containing protein [Galbitalea sp.]
MEQIYVFIHGVVALPHSGIKLVEIQMEVTKVDPIVDLKEIDFGPLGYAASIRLPQFASVDVVIRPGINGGRPTLRARGIAVDDVLGRVRAGEAPGEVADDYGISHDEVMYLNRVAA